MTAEPRVDLLFLACNRLAFTQEAFAALLENTDWNCAQTLHVIDDGSVDGTDAWLESQFGRVPCPVTFRRTRFGSPVAAMAHFIEAATAPLLAKVDNDAMMPPGWLRQSLAVLDRHPELSFLGLEALYPHDPAPDIERGYATAEFISGLGVYRRAAFADSRPQPQGRWFGFEAWQAAQGKRLVAGWIVPALPVFLLDRVPFDPWRSHTQTYVRRGWQRAWPPYPPDSALWRWRWGDEPARVSPARAGGEQIVCAMRIKNEAKHIGEVLTRALALCERALVFDDHSTDDTAAICRAFGERVTVIPSPFEGLDEARDKNYLLKQVIALGAAWVLWIDGDEALELSGPDKIRAALQQARDAAAFSLRIAYVWDDPEHVRVDGIFGRFTRPSLFRLRGQPLARLAFPTTGFGGNFHCGNVPQGLLGRTVELDVRLKHYGYMLAEQRQAKYTWYTTIDPNNEAEDNYRHLAGAPGARYAPSPPAITRWVE